MEARSQCEDRSAALEAARTKVTALEAELASVHAASAQKDLQLMSVDADSVAKMKEELGALQQEVGKLKSKCSAQALELAEGHASVDESRRAWELERRELERQLGRQGPISNAAVGQSAHLAALSDANAEDSSEGAPWSLTFPAEGTGEAAPPAALFQPGSSGSDSHLAAEINTLRAELSKQLQAAEAASAQAAAAQDLVEQLEGSASSIEQAKVALQHDVDELKRAAAKAEASWHERATTLKARTTNYVAQLKEVHREALDESTSRAKESEARLREATAELKATQAAAAATLSALRQQLAANQRTAALRMKEAVADERSLSNAAIATLSLDLNALEVAPPNVKGAMEAMEAATRRAEQARSQANEGEAKARMQLEEVEEKRAKEANTARSLIEALQREVELLSKKATQQPTATAARPPAGAADAPRRIMTAAVKVKPGMSRGAV